MNCTERLVVPSLDC